MNEIIELAQKLIRIPSVSGNKEEILKVFAEVREYFKGTEAVIREYPFGEGGVSPVLMISNKDTEDFDALALVHIDVVPASEEGQYEPIIKDGKMYARGSIDMKTQAAMTLVNLKHAMAKGLPISYGVLMVSDEETTGSGIRGFLEKNPNLRVEVLLDVDAGDLTDIIYKYKHPVVVKLVYNGREGHSAYPWRSDNSVTGLRNALSFLEKSFTDFNKGPEPKDTWVSTLAVTDFKTDFKATNAIPGHSEAILSARLTDGMPYEEFEKLLDDCKKETGAEYEIMVSSKGMYMDKDNPYVNEYRKIAKRIVGETIAMNHEHGATDSRFFSGWASLSGGETSVIVHRCNGENEHSKGEFVILDSVDKFAQIQQEFLDYLSKNKG